MASAARALIVRPETELVAGEAIAYLQRLDRDSVAVDLGTGSGAIALAIACETSRTTVHAVDVDPAALSLARENIQRHERVLAEMGSSVAVHRGDLRAFDFPGGADVVVPNPPYLPSTERVSGDVSHDHELALYGGVEDGLDLPTAVLGVAARVLRPEGLLVVEHHDDQGAALRGAARSRGFRDVRTHRDLAGRERYLTARVCTSGCERGRIAP